MAIGKFPVLIIGSTLAIGLFQTISKTDKPCFKGHQSADTNKETKAYFSLQLINILSGQLGYVKAQHTIRVDNLASYIGGFRARSQENIRWGHLYRLSSPLHWHLFTKICTFLFRKRSWNQWRPNWARGNTINAYAPFHKLKGKSSMKATVAPSSAKQWHTARPIPESPPVTSAILPFTLSK
ncbi:hypothetical protein H5410_011403 [Solanum commersonii]|uniref:Uncharacterized protein n=1 Tax=Solanum commersonii TaxID=4109 RepID=A0A9J6APC7_SOLCO|nr:hypothetical protein H5410_011403 [Solanum commersonii]